MESVKTRGIITKCRDFGESNCMMTVLADGLGVISVSAYGVRSKKSKTRVRLFSCCDFVLGKKSGDIFRMEQMDLVDSFYPICEDIEKLSLANYLADIARDAFETSDGNILSLLLNTIYVISYKEVSLSLVKAVFELKIAQLMGYEPIIDSCIKCGSTESVSAFDISGGVKCKTCQTGQDLLLKGGTYAAIRHILYGEDAKLFSFSVSDEVKSELSKICEKYILDKCEKNYKSLEYLKNIM